MTYAEPLTARELQVLQLIAEGLPNKGIARALNISENTAKFHVASLCAKLDASSRVEAVTAGVRLGLRPGGFRESIAIEGVVCRVALKQILAEELVPAMSHEDPIQTLA